MGKGRPPKIVEEFNTIWKRTKAKKALMEIFSIVTSEDMVFLYKEIKDKIYLRYTFEWKTIDKKDMKKYLEPLGEEVSFELSCYLDEAFKKYKKQNINEII
jgi:hypothetical protein